VLKYDFDLSLIDFRGAQGFDANGRLLAEKVVSVGQSVLLL